MKSIKPGRGPSMLGGVASVGMMLFGMVWTGLVAQSGAPAAFVLFGVIFIILGGVQALYNFKNATGENRYSSFDIVDDQEEIDPLNARYGKQAVNQNQTNDLDALSNEVRFCPYCGAPVKSDYSFCSKCGKKI